MAGAAAAHLLIGRVRGRAAGIADRGDPHSRSLPEYSFGAPEAAETEHRLLKAGGIRARQRMAVDEMPFGDLARLGAARQAILGLRNDQLVTHEPPHLASLFQDPAAITGRRHDLM